MVLSQMFLERASSSSPRDPEVGRGLKRGHRTTVRSEKSMTAQLEQLPETEGQSVRWKVTLRLEGGLPAVERWAGDHQGEDWG